MDVYKNPNNSCSFFDIGLGGYLFTFARIKPKMAQNKAPSQTVRAGWLNLSGFCLGRIEAYLFKYLDIISYTHAIGVKKLKDKIHRYLWPQWIIVWHS